MKIDCCGKVRMIFAQPAKLRDIAWVGTDGRTLIGGRHCRILAFELRSVGVAGWPQCMSWLLDWLCDELRDQHGHKAFRVSRLLPVNSADYILPREADLVRLGLYVRLYFRCPSRTGGDTPQGLGGCTSASVSR